MQREIELQGTNMIHPSVIGTFRVWTKIYERMLQFRLTEELSRWRVTDGKYWRLTPRPFVKFDFDFTEAFGDDGHPISVDNLIEVSTRAILPNMREKGLIGMYDQNLYRYVVQSSSKLDYDNMMFNWELNGGEPLLPRHYKTHINSDLVDQGILAPALLFTNNVKITSETVTIGFLGTFFYKMKKGADNIPANIKGVKILNKFVDYDENAFDDEVVKNLDSRPWKAVIFD